MPTLPHSPRRCAPPRLPSRPGAPVILSTSGLTDKTSCSRLGSFAAELLPGKNDRDASPASFLHGKIQAQDSGGIVRRNPGSVNAFTDHHPAEDLPGFPVTDVPAGIPVHAPQRAVSTDHDCWSVYFHLEGTGINSRKICIEHQVAIAPVKVDGGASARRAARLQYRPEMFGIPGQACRSTPAKSFLV